MDMAVVKNQDGKMQGVSPTDDSAWKVFWNKLKNIHVGEMLKISFSTPRNQKFHKKYFALLNLGYEHWTPARKHKTHKGVQVEKNFDVFRDDVQILAGFYTLSFGVDGAMKTAAKSISFAKMEHDEFERVYDSVVNVILKNVLTNYSRKDLDEVVEKMMGFL